MVDRLFQVKVRTATPDSGSGQLPVRLELSSNFCVKYLHITIANAWAHIKHEVIMLDFPASWPLFLQEYLSPGDVVEVSFLEGVKEDSFYLQVGLDSAQLEIKKMENRELGIQFQFEITRDLPYLPDMRDMVFPWCEEEKS